ncbi:hypothetical protein ACLMJK_008237 [Lecanora helva]
MAGSTIPLEGLFTRAAYLPSKDTFTSAPDLRTVLTTWFPLFFLTVVATGYFANPLKHIPMANPKTGSWLSNFLREPRAPEVVEYQKDTPNVKGLFRYRGVLGKQRLHVTTTDGFQEVLQEKSYIMHKWTVTKRVLGPLMGDGLLLQEDDPHKNQRRKLGPSFAPRHINELHQIFWSKAGTLIDVLTKQSQTGPVNLTVWSARAMFDIISLAVFDGDVEMLTKPGSDVSKAYGQLFSPATANQTSNLRSTLGVVLPRKLLQALPLERNQEIEVNNVVIRSWIRDCINKEKELLKDPNHPQSLNIINVTLRSTPDIDVEHLIDQLMTILVAGHETSSHSLSWALFYLAHNTTMQNRLRKEIRENLPPLDQSSKFDQANLDKLPLVKAVCEETLRLRPVVPLLYRQASEPTSILGEPISKGTVVSLSPYGINRNPEIWGKDADTWNPDRWMGPTNPTKGSKNSMYSFASFSHGPRQCLGINFARAQLADILAAVIGTLEVVPGGPEPVGAFGLVTLKPAGGIKVRFNKLNEWAEPLENRA